MKLDTLVYRDWSNGVNNSLRAEELPENASPRGLNSALVAVSLDKAVVGKRRGANLVLPYALYEADNTTLAQFTSIFQFSYYDGAEGALEPSFLTTTKSGVLNSIDLLDKEHTEITDTFLTADTPNPIWAQLENAAYVANGTDQKKIINLSGTLTPQRHGIVAPTKATSNAVSDGDFFAEATSGGAMTASTWDVLLTYYNSNTNHESSPSDWFTLSVGSSGRILVTFDETPADTQITHVRVYMRKQGVQTQFLRLQAWQFAITDSPQYFGTAADIDTALMLTYAPDVGSNDPPPSTTLGWVVHNSRLFGWDAQNVYWSDISEDGPEPESFRAENYQPVAPNDGSIITSCHVANDNVLVIFKDNSMFGLFGSDPTTAELRSIDPTLGCIAPNSVVTIEGYTYWWSRLGPVKWAGPGAAPEQIGYSLLGATTAPSNVFYENAHNIVAAADSTRQKIIFAFPTADEPTYNNLMIAYSYRLNVWETSGWDPFDVSCINICKCENNRLNVYMGGYFGKIYKWWVSDVDGIRVAKPQRNADSVTESGGELEIDLGSTHDYVVGQYVKIYGFDNIAGLIHPLEGVNLQITSVDTETITVTYSGTYASFAGSSWLIFCDFTLSGQVVSSTSTSLVVPTTTNIDNPELVVGQYLYAISPNQTTYQRRRISGVTANSFTFDIASSWTVEPDSSYTWVLSGPFFEWDTKWQDFTAPFDEKRFMFAYCDAVCDTGTTSLYMDVFTKGILNGADRSFVLDITGSGAIFDVSSFDASVFGGESISRLRKRIAKVGYSFRYRMRHYENNRQLVILRLGNSAHILGDRRT